MVLHPDNPAILILDSCSFEVVRYAWPGVYPVFYITHDSAVLCATCVQEEIEQCIDPDAQGWFVVGHAANFEDPDMYCAHCNERIESAYAEVE